MTIPTSVSCPFYPVTVAVSSLHCNKNFLPNWLYLVFCRFGSLCHNLVIFIDIYTADRRVGYTECIGARAGLVACSVFDIWEGQEWVSDHGILQIWVHHNLVIFIDIYM